MSTMSSKRAQKCTMCKALATKHCTRCSTPYCTLECQIADHPLHKTLCAAYGSIPRRRLKTSDACDVLSFLFPSNSPKPRLVYVHRWLQDPQPGNPMYSTSWQTSAAHEHLNDDPSSSSPVSAAQCERQVFMTNYLQNRGFPHALEITYRTQFLNPALGLPRNQSVIHATDNRMLRHDWRGSLVVSRLSTSGYDPGTYYDVDLTDLRHAVDYFEAYGRADLRDNFNGRGHAKIQGVRVDFDGDADKGSPQFTTVEVAIPHPVLLSKASELSVRIGTPVKAMKYPTSALMRKHDQFYNNQHKANDEAEKTGTQNQKVPTSTLEETDLQPAASPQPTTTTMTTVNKISPTTINALSLSHLHLNLTVDPRPSSSSSDDFATTPQYWSFDSNRKTNTAALFIRSDGTPLTPLHLYSMLHFAQHVIAPRIVQPNLHNTVPIIQDGNKNKNKNKDKNKDKNKNKHLLARARTRQQRQRFLDTLLTKHSFQRFWEHCTLDPEMNVNVNVNANATAHQNGNDSDNKGKHEDGPEEDQKKKNKKQMSSSREVAKRGREKEWFDDSDHDDNDLADDNNYVTFWVDIDASDSDSDGN